MDMVFLHGTSSKHAPTSVFEYQIVQGGLCAYFAGVVRVSSYVAHHAPKVCSMRIHKKYRFVSDCNPLTRLRLMLSKFGAADELPSVGLATDGAIELPASFVGSLYFLLCKSLYEIMCLHRLLS